MAFVGGNGDVATLVGKAVVSGRSAFVAYYRSAAHRLTDEEKVGSDGL